MAVPRSAAHLLTLAIVLLAGAAPAQAQDRTPTPSAQELWRDYPLAQDSPTRERSAAPSPVRAASRSTVATGSGPEPIVVAVPVTAALIAAAVGGALLARRRRGSTEMIAGPAATAPRLAVAGPTAGSDRILFSHVGRDRAQRSVRAEPPQEPPGLRPPDPDERWTAEIQWTRSGDTARFCVVARDERGESEPVIARSDPFDWPPEGTEAVEALVGADDALSEALTLAGWTPLPRGEAWYAKRFAWEPEPASEWAPPRPSPSVTPVEPERAPTRRFRSAGEWPPGTEAQWRCAITWRPGYARSRFEVVMHDPTGEEDDRVIAASPPFKWLFMGDPDPSDATFRDAVLDLAATLESVGWERVGVGTPWYAARFVWRGDEPPPDDVLVQAARRAS
jgi:hypothetical protein